MLTLTLLLVMITAHVEAAHVHGGAEQVVHSFQAGSDGSMPAYGLTGDGAGTLYGTTDLGGSQQCERGCGTVYELVNSGSHYVEHILYRFPQGLVAERPAYPRGTLIVGNDGSLTGLSGYSPPVNGRCIATAYRLEPKRRGYRLRVLYCFKSIATYPNPDLLAGKAGTFYGTAFETSASNLGAAFQLVPRHGGYSIRILHHFEGGSDGSDPTSGLVMDASGSLYGTTWGGGNAPACGGAHGVWDGCGTVFQLAPSQNGYTEAVLHAFGYKLDGIQPMGPLIVDSEGTLYGTTERGGRCGGGTVFKLARVNGSYTERVIYDFCQPRGPGAPIGPVVSDAAGSLYGTTSEGGPRSGGAVFKLRPTSHGYEERDLYIFRGFPDGSDPQSSLYLDASGALFGTTPEGGVPMNGSTQLCGNRTGCGTVYKITP